MNPRLVYVIGPSGAGKDSLLQWVMQHARSNSELHLARRSITRLARPDAEPHEAVSLDQFSQLCKSGQFALHWDANGLRYGVRSSQLAPLSLGHCVLVNGSRAHLDEARGRFPGLTAVHISVHPDRLKQRLAQRGRETANAVAERLRRNHELAPPHGCTDINNDGPIVEAGRALLDLLDTLTAAPRLHQMQRV